MIDEFDYMEPNCPLSGGKDFYDPDPDAPRGHIPVRRILEKVDALFGRNEYAEAGKLLVYWRDEARSLRDRHGELALESELIGYYRKTDDCECGIRSVFRALALIEELHQDETASGATVLINCATAYKAFGLPADALPLYERAERVYQSTLEADDARFGGLYNNMAITLASLGRVDDAKHAYRAALEIMSRIENGEAESAITYINLAYLYEAEGKSERRADCMQQARRLLRSDNLPRDGYYAFVLEKCAPAFAEFGEEALSEQMKKEAKEIYERT